MKIVWVYPPLLVGTGSSYMYVIYYPFITHVFAVKPPKIVGRFSK